MIYSNYYLSIEHKLQRTPYSKTFQSIHWRKIVYQNFQGRQLLALSRLFPVKQCFQHLCSQMTKASLQHQTWTHPWIRRNIYIFEANLKWTLRFFATAHSLMNDTNMIDSCQAHLPVQYSSNIELIPQKWHWCCDWQQATLVSHMQNKPFACSISCPCSRWLFHFSV